MKDYSGIIETEIEPLIKQIKIICLKNNIPFFFAMARKDDDEVTEYDVETSKEDLKKKAEDGSLKEYYADMLTPIVSGTKLTQDKITKMLCIMAGFDVIPPKETIEIDF